MKLPSSTVYFRPGLAQNPFGRIYSGAIHIDVKGTGSTKMRQLGWYQLILVLKGEGFYRDVQGTGYPLSSGELLITTPGLPHQYGPSKGTAWSTLVLMFNGPLFEALQQSGWLTSRHHAIMLSPIDKWYRKFGSLLHLKPDEAQHPMGYLNRFLTIVSELPLGVQKTTAEDRPAWLTTAIAMIESADPIQPLDVRKIAQKCQLGYESFRHQFAAIVGHGPSAYHRNLRIKTASELIAYGNDSFKQIALQLGYCDVFYFIKDFKEKTGLTPGQFRTELVTRNIKVVDTEQVQKMALQKWLKAEEEKRQLEEQHAAERRRVWRLVFSDDFLTPAAASHWDISGKWEIRDGELRIRGEEFLFAILKTPFPGDVRLVFDCRLASESLSDVSCFLGTTLSSDANRPHQSGYYFQYGGWGNKKNILGAHGNILWNQPATPLVRDRLFHVEAQKVGNRLMLHVDGETIMDVRDPAPVFGSAHAFLGVSSWGTHACFSNIRVYTHDSASHADLMETASDFFTRGNFSTARDLFQEVRASSHDPKRTEQAENGIALTTRLIQLTNDFSTIKSQLLTRWPRAGITMGSRGLIININQQEIKDLSPLQGLPLSELSCNNNRITTLEPLRGMQLTRLSCYQNRIRNLDPIRGMPLSFLELSNNQITSLEPLQGMKISCLACADNQIKDLEPLRNMGLMNLTIDHNQIRSLEPLCGMSLNILECSRNQIADLVPLQGMVLDRLDCSGNQVTTLEPLRGMPLGYLNCASNAISDLNPMRGMNPYCLICNDNQIASLDPLRGMKLATLFAENNPLKSLEPLLECFPKWMRVSTDTLDNLERKFIRNRVGEENFDNFIRNSEILRHWKRRSYRQIQALARASGTRRYAIIPLELTWADANVICKKLGGHLAVIRTQEDNEIVKAMALHSGGAWIGLSNANGTRTWVTGESVRYHQADPNHELDGGYRILPSGTWRTNVPWQKTFAFCVEW